MCLGAGRTVRLAETERTTMACDTNDEAAKARRAIADIPQQLAALKAMTVGQLRERYREVFGEPTRSRNKDFLRKKVAWRIQELAEGGLSDHARARIEELAAHVPVRWRKRSSGAAQASVTASPAEASAPATRDPRLPPPGTVLVREHGGVEHRVTVLADGFEYDSQRYESLSKVARAISGTNWNGYLFFSLQRRTRKGAAEAAA
jgi:hypothetical protein